MPKTNIKKSDLIVGAHFSIGKGFKSAFQDAVDINANAMQFFAKNPMAFKLKKVKQGEADEVKDFYKNGSIKYTVIHCSYLLNFARTSGQSPDMAGKPTSKNKSSFAITSLVEDLNNAEVLGADGVVLHLGKFLKMEESEAEENFVKNIKAVLERTKSLKAKIILENTAGQGTEMGFKLKDLGRIYKKLNKHKRIKFCFDTAHAFGAGYDLKIKEGAEETIKEIEKNLGLKNIVCIHLNDSKKVLGSRVDRHEDIGEGTIGEAGLKFFITELIKTADQPIPLILETPQGFKDYKTQIVKVKNWF